ncbi:ABC transporter permease [Pseudonocardia ailaonensis]|uniref:ABC transporter permease n=1 Tax=Pseudonocardia ailaonensis TaxID=367279 RepID=A0ABN2MU40_9PSEU
MVWGAATLSFLGLHLLKGDPARIIAGGGGAVSGQSQQILDQINAQYGFRQPLVVQYGRFLGELVTGDLGMSYQLNQRVTSVISDQLWSTVVLALGAAVLGFVLSLVLAVATAGRPRARSLSSTVELVLVSTPGFFVGILLLTVFSFRLGWFPVFGDDGIGSLVLPWLTLALPIAGTLSLVMREGLERALEQPFALTVRARGASATRLRLRHAVRHALLPVLTLSGWMLGALLGGVVVVETVFARAGIGQVAVTAVNGRDLPVVTGVVLVATIAFVVINTGLDALYRVVDPRLGSVAQ